jgi:cytochrome c-type biogenesis protein CcmH
MNGRHRALLLVLALCVTPPLAAQAIDPLPFKDRNEEIRFQQLAAQLRCLVCQNETLADSNAGLAHDLRQQVFAQIQAGRSDEQIKHYMVDRYSDFVLYDPPLKPGTWLLWFGPWLLLLAGLATVAITVRKRRHTAAADQEQW